MKNLILTLFLASIYLACSTNNSDTKDTQQHEDIAHNHSHDGHDHSGHDHEETAKVLVDSSLNVRIVPPSNWVAVPPQILLTAVATFDSVAKYPIRPKAIYADQPGVSVLMLSDLTQLSDKGYQNILERPEDYLNPNTIWEAFDYQKIELNGLAVDQFTLSNSSATNYKLIFTKDVTSKFQVDYIIPSNQDTTQVKDQILESMKTIQTSILQ